jgi:hypothetical protein
MERSVKSELVTDTVDRFDGCVWSCVHPGGIGGKQVCQQERYKRDAKHYWQSHHETAKNVTTHRQFLTRSATLIGIQSVP